MSSQRFLEADRRTTDLARPVVTAADVDHYLRYQQALLRGVNAKPPQAWGEAHTHALEESGLTAALHGPVASVCRAFAGALSIAEVVRRRLEEARQRRDEARVATLAPELERLTQGAAWTARFGEVLAAALEARADRLVDLHEQTLAAELRPSPATD